MNTPTRKAINPLESIRFDVVKSRIDNLNGQYFRALLKTDDPVERAWIKAQSLALSTFKNSLDPDDLDGLNRALEILRGREINF